MACGMESLRNYKLTLFELSCVMGISDKGGHIIVDNKLPAILICVTQVLCFIPILRYVPIQLSYSPCKHGRKAYPKMPQSDLIRTKLPMVNNYIGL